MISKTAKILSIIVIVLGGLFAVSGVTAYVATTNVLSQQNITVAEDANCLAGAVVNNPLAAWCQQDIISQHALKATGGKTYAEMDREDPLREVAMSGSTLRASLFTSVLAFAMSALVTVVGIVFILLGWANLSKARVE